MKRAWIVDGSWIASNVKNASKSSTLKIQDCGACINCPNCSYRIDNSNVETPWPGFPKGVKFDPTDEEVIEHLEAKCGINGLKPHCFINDFICSITDDVGINYTHPQNLPGVNEDGVSVFFFNKTAQAYPKGQRKRRKVTHTSLKDESVRWHKTGQTKPLMVNGVQKGCKKIMVLYKNRGKGVKPEKTNWVLHQYHLGTEEGEVGEFVASKITYQQQKQCGDTANENESFVVGDGPRTPKHTTSIHPCPEIFLDEDERAYDDTNRLLDSFIQGIEEIPDAYFATTSGGRSQAANTLNDFEDNLVCKEVKARSPILEKSPSYGNVDFGSVDYTVSDLENVDFGTLSDLLTFGPEDSSLNWLDGFKVLK